AAAQVGVAAAGDRARDPALRVLAQHHALRIEPPPLVEQAAEAASVVAVLLDRVLVVDPRDEPLVRDEEQREAGRLVDAAALRLDDAVLDLIAHAQAVAPADAVGLGDELHAVPERDPVQRDRVPFFEAHGDFFALHRDAFAPGRDAHDRLDDRDAGVEALEVLRLVRGA